jgi:thiol-disulfide isomerase/thioredoxin
MSRTAQRLALACIASLLPILHAQSPLPAAAQQSYQQGLDAEQQDELDLALDRFQAALHQSPDAPICYEAILRVQSKMGDDKAALATDAKMLSTAPNPQARAHAEQLAAEIYYRQWSAYTTGGGAFDKNPKRAQQSLEKSEAALQRASTDDPANEPLRMLHAHVLAALHRDEDASREFVACAAIPGTSPTECTRALKLSRNADLGRLEPAPSFHATTSDGQPVSLDALAGKVVLIDFWGSWCHFCVRDSGYVQSMLDSFDPRSFVLLEVDEGDSPDTWSTYVKSNRLQGVQVQDTNRQLQSLFHVTGFPTYIILDRDGLIHTRVSGAVGDLRGDIRKLVNQPSNTPPAAAPSLSGN